MKIKVLKIKDIYAVDLDWEDDVNELISELKKSSIEILPAFNRNGVYCRGNVCWVEINGRAFYIDKKDFDYTLNEYNYRERPLTQKEFEAISIIRNRNPRLYKKHNLGKLYNQELQRRDIIDIQRGVARAFLQIDKENK